MARQVLHQVLTSAMAGDAITDHAFLLCRWLREMGYVSRIYAGSIDPKLRRRVRPLTAYQSHVGDRWLIYHHSIGSSVVEWLHGVSQRLILIYHNVTPPEYFGTLQPALARQTALGREQLRSLKSRTGLALAVSAYNERDLVAAGFTHTGVLPIVLDAQRYDLPSNPELAGRLDTGAPTLLFVGRLAPNKKQEDLIQLLYYYRRIVPSARLALVGADWLRSYGRSLREWARVLGMEEGVSLTGRVSQRDMVTYYRTADVYVSMSEHEGFGKPLIESMYLGLPVLAYAAAAVPDTLGGAGVLFHHKAYEALAEVVDMLVCDGKMRKAVIARQRERVQTYLATTVLQTWKTYLAQLSW